MGIPALVGAGSGQPCSEVALFPGEQPPSGSSNLDGSLSCSEVVGSINGVSISNFIIETGLGVSLLLDPLANTLNLDFDLSGLAICPVSSESI